MEEWLVWAFVVATRGTWMTSLHRSSSTIQESLRRTFCHRPHKHHTAFGKTPSHCRHLTHHFISTGAPTTSDTIDDTASIDSHGATAHAVTWAHIKVDAAQQAACCPSDHRRLHQWTEAQLLRTLCRPQHGATTATTCPTESRNYIITNYHQLPYLAMAEDAPFGRSTSQSWFPGSRLGLPDRWLPRVHLQPHPDVAVLVTQAYVFTGAIGAATADDCYNVIRDYGHGCLPSTLPSKTPSGRSLDHHPH